MMVSNASQSTTKAMKSPAMATRSFICVSAARDTLSGFCRKQKFLQRGKLVGKGDGFLRPAEKSRQPLGHFRANAGGPRNGFSELCGMRRRQDDSLRGALILLGEILPAEHADRGVRIENVAVALLDVMHHAQGLFVSETAAPDVAANRLQIVVVQVDDAREIAGVP